MRLLTRAYISQLSRTSAIGCSRETRGRAVRLCSFFFVKTTTTMTLKPYRCTSSTFRTRRCNCHLLSARSLSFWNGLVWSSLMVLSSKERRGVVRSQILFPRTCRLLLDCNRYDQIRKKFTPLRILFPLTHCMDTTTASTTIPIERDRFNVSMLFLFFFFFFFFVFRFPFWRCPIFERFFFSVQKISRTKKK